MIIDILAVISFTDKLLKTSSEKVTIPYEVIHSNILLFRIQELEEKFNKKLISMDQLFKAANMLKTSHQPLAVNILEKYGIQPDHLVKGVFCPECGAVLMRWANKTWHCVKCHCYSKDAHLAAINDYILLYGNQMTNKQAREFLKEESRHVLKRLMKKAGFTIIGYKKGSIYQLKMRY
ncbi:hypothetical protein [Oceanobacillus salinisoli]|uniref:hypothetical protein n=1 Tax=Oceanobacillus salinisoli TaxID=2678611 RepID=UPI0012E1BAE6|nr:hypothetical protein [Oceanobacillus salinisoli]